MLINQSINQSVCSRS